MNTQTERLDLVQEDACIPRPETEQKCEQTTPEQRKQRLLREYTIFIDFLSIGCVITIGCKKIPFTTSSDALAAIAEYTEDPVKTTEKWLKKLA